MQINTFPVVRTSNVLPMEKLPLLVHGYAIRSARRRQRGDGTAVTVFRQGCKVKYAFIALHRLQFSVRTMCRLLRVHPSGFYTGLKNPLSRRAIEDKRQTDLLLTAWEESGKVYGLSQAARRPSRSGRDLLPEPGRASDASRRDQGADRLQMPSARLWGQAFRHYRQHARPAI